MNLTQLTDWLASHPNGWGLLLLGAAALIEYVFPPFPGDAIVVFGTFLVVRRGWSAAGVFGSVLLGSAIGSMAVYAVGRALADRGHRRPAIDAIIARFSRHGALYLVLNRFLPSVRALFFVAAGMARLPWAQVLGWGLVSAAAWNAILLALGLALGASWEKLQTILVAYSEVAWALLGIVVSVALFRWWRKRKR